MHLRGEGLPSTFSGKPFAAMSFRVSICPKCVGYPSMWMNISLATFRCLYRVSWSLKAFRRAADSLAMIERSSAAVLQALTALIKSLQVNKDQRVGQGEHATLLVNSEEKTHLCDTDHF